VRLVRKLFFAFTAIILGCCCVFCEDTIQKSTEAFTLPVSSAPATFIIKAVGDIMMGSLYPESNLPKNIKENIFENVAGDLEGADILLGNLEGAITEREKSVKKVNKKNAFAFRMPKEYISYLVKSGFTVLNVANNHARDFGPEGLEDTICNVESSSIACTGPAGKITLFERNGIKIGIVSFYWNELFNDLTNIPRVTSKVARYKEGLDVLIITFHGGGEGEKFLHVKDRMEIFEGAKRGNLVKFAHAAIDAGADIVIGHGPHLPRAMEFYKGKLIAYSLGNFCTYGGFNLLGPRKYSLVLEVELDAKGGFVTGRIHPVILQNRGIPYSDSTGESIKLIRNLTSDDFPDSPILIDDSGVIKKAGSQ
jgi:hypothetical protein